jgi:sec-independent protein translocase protein TatA
MFGLGPFEIVVIGAIAVMLYGKRLPEVGRSAGKTLGELRRQWTTLAKELDVAAHIEGRTPRPAVATRYASDEADSRQVAAPRFDPPPAPDTAG